MKEDELKFLGFTKKENKHEGWWYELKFKEHLFISCDDGFAKGNNNSWIIGYQNLKEDLDIYWFGSKVNQGVKFMSLFEILTDRLFSLNGVHKKVTK